MYKYENAQRYLLYNYDDPDLHPICLRTPAPPEDKYIDNYGLPPLEQKFQYHSLPPKLKALEELAVEKLKEWAEGGVNKKVSEYRVIKKFWEMLEAEQKFYKDEIRYIEKVRFYLVYGQWIFIKGVPTWLPPTYFRYLNFWYYPDVPGNRPEYRDADRRAYMFKWYCRTTNETLGNLDDKGYAQKDANGKYVIIKKPNRTVYGHAKVKRRREGATNQECSDILWVAEGNLGRGNSICPIMAETGEGATYIYETYMREGWLHQPIFLRPFNNVTQNSSEIKFVAPAGEYGVKAVGSRIFPVETAESSGLDKTKTHSALFDEGAKKVAGSDVYYRHGVVKPTAAQYLDIHGYMAYPTTVEEMENGGAAYRDIWDSSGFYRRPANGQTTSGLLRIFQPAYEGLDKHIDFWGASVIEDPTPEQIKYAPPGAAFVDGIGAKRRLETEYNNYLAEATPKSMRDYREGIRRRPLTVAHCWVGTAGDLGWDTIKLDEREAELLRDKRMTENFELKWYNDIPDHPKGVVAVRDANGRFQISNLLLGHNNEVGWTRGATVWNESTGRFEKARMPKDPLLCMAGADPFDYGNTPGYDHSMKSRGGFYVMLNYDPLIDGERDKKDWITETTICTYCYTPPSIEEYYEDVLKGIVFFQAMLNQERNKTGLWKYIIDRGYGGYLLRMIRPDGTIDPKPGVFTGQGWGDKDGYFNAANDYINDHIHREKHVGLIQQMKEIQRPDQLRHYDLLTAAMVCWIGKKYGHHRTLNRMHTNIQISLKGTPLDPRRRR